MPAPHRRKTQDASSRYAGTKQQTLPHPPPPAHPFLQQCQTADLSMKRCPIPQKRARKPNLMERPPTRTVRRCTNRRPATRSLIIARSTLRHNSRPALQGAVRPVVEALYRRPRYACPALFFFSSKRCMPQIFRHVATRVYDRDVRRATTTHTVEVASSGESQ